MIRKAVLTALLLCLLLTAAFPGVVRAGDGLSVISNSAVMEFPSRLVFDIAAESDADITDIRLHYRVDRMEHARITSEIYVGFTPARSVDAQWVWDMRMTGGLPPGSGVSYWWTVTDAQNNTVRTEPQSILIEDNRYDWRSLTEGQVTLYWYKGDDDFAEALMEFSQQALGRLEANTGAALENPVRIYIYASSADLQGSMIYPQEWTGGVAYTRYGVVAMGISPSGFDFDWGERVISHELTHLVIHQITFNPYSGLPTWLDEGLAMSSEGELQASFLNVLERARKESRLITVRSLASPFSVYADESLLAYGQSYMLVTYLIDEYGRDKMFELLGTFRQGSSYDEALEQVYGFDMDGLNTRWRADFEVAQ